MLSKKTIKSAIESMMFISGDLLDAKEASNIFNISLEQVVECFEELQAEYEQEGRGIVIRRVNDSFQFVTKKENEEYISKLFTPVKIKRLSQSALEVLAIIAYKQPITKGEIDGIRGIKSDRVIDGLVAKGLVEEKGRSESVGKPILYGTTDVFLKHFGLVNINELPDIDMGEDDWDINGDLMDKIDRNQLTFEFANEDKPN